MLVTAAMNVVGMALLGLSFSLSSEQKRSRITARATLAASCFLFLLAFGINCGVGLILD